MEPDSLKKQSPATVGRESIRNNLFPGKSRRCLRRFSLFDFIVDHKRTNSRVVKKSAANRPKNHSTLNSNRIGKRKKSHSRLRKKILLNRKSKLKILDQTVTDDDLVERIASLDISNPAPPKMLHSRRFRSYCDNTTSPRLLELTEQLLREIFRFQARAYDKNQIKARAHKRYVLGLKECLRQLAANKVKLMIIAPDCEPCSISGGIDDMIRDLIGKCLGNKIPYVFALGRRKLGYVLFKKAPVSCVGILNYDGAQIVYRELLDCLETEKANYEEIFKGI